MKLANFDFAIIVFVIIKRYARKLFKNILNDVQTKGNGGDNCSLTLLLKMYFDTLYVEGLKSKF